MYSSFCLSTHVRSGRDRGDARTSSHPYYELYSPNSTPDASEMKIPFPRRIIPTFHVQDGISSFNSLQHAATKTTSTMASSEQMNTEALHVVLQQSFSPDASLRDPAEKTIANLKNIPGAAGMLLQVASEKQVLYHRDYYTLYSK